MQPIVTESHIDALLVRSEDVPVMLFKHSTRCNQSSRAKQQYEALVATTAGVAFAIVHVIEDRAVSQQLAARIGVEHESPQVLLLHRGQVVWHTSHEAITQSAMQQALSEL